MIHLVDESLRTAVQAGLADSGEIEVAFDPPTDDWTSKRQGPAVNCYLYGIAEQTDRRLRQWVDVIGDDGLVHHRTMSPRQYKLSYLLTVWAGRPEDEHRLLAAIIDHMARTDNLVVATAPEQVVSLPMSVALPQAAGRPFPDVWGSLKISVRPALDVIVVAPFGPRVIDVAAPVTEEPRLDMFDGDGTLLDVSGDADLEEVAAGKDPGSPWPAGPAAFNGEKVGPRRPRPISAPGGAGSGSTSG